MEPQPKNIVIIIVLAVFITALVVGGGVYIWQKGEADLHFLLPSG